MWALRGLRNGVLTTRWPARGDDYAAAARAQATVRQQPGPSGLAGPAGPADLAALCPSGAISQDPGGLVRIDRGGCISCGRCVAARPDVFAWAAGPDSAALTRHGLVVPPADETADRLAAVSAELRARTRALRRSVHLRHVDAGSDGSEEWEIMALLNPVYYIPGSASSSPPAPGTRTCCWSPGPGPAACASRCAAPTRPCRTRSWSWRSGPTRSAAG